jgi:hypothetical protein
MHPLQTLSSSTRAEAAQAVWLPYFVVDMRVRMHMTT